MPSMRFFVRLFPLALFVGSLGDAIAADVPSPLPRFATHVLSPITCANTPFGRHVTLGGDAEALNLIATAGSFNNFDEYEPAPPLATPPLTRTFRAGLYPAALAGTKFLRAISVDLNGDGRDEVVTANRVDATGALKLGVFRRGAGPTAELFDTWVLPQAFTAVDLAAGDFDGSTDHKQELAVLVRTATTGLRVFVLTGGSNGGILETDNASAGSWNRSSATGSVSLAAADMLLDGRDQIVVVSESGSGGTRTLNYHLLEFQPQTAALPIVAGDTAIGSAVFTSVLGTSYEADNGTPTIDSILKIEADAGDIVDSAAAELVVYTQFKQSKYDYIGQRLHHFTTVRDSGNHITAIGFANRGAGQEYDFSHLVQGQNENGLASFEATVANVDRVSPSEAVLVRSESSPRLMVEAFKAEVDLAAGYTYLASGLTVQFNNTSTGSIATHEWNFGDSSGPIFDINPTHIFTAAGTYTVNLKVTDTSGGIRNYSHAIAVTSSGNSNGGIAPGYMYHMKTTPTYSASYPVAGSTDLSFVNVAVADMDKDGIAEVMTAARNTSSDVLRSIWRLHDTAVPASFAGTHFTETSPDFNNMTAMDLVASDFDGDSVQATLGTDCRQVEEPQLRQVIWLPPYFQRLQVSASKLSTFGESTTGGSSIEEQSGSFTSHDVSAYIGVSVGAEIAGVEASAKITAGYNYQTNHGAIHSSENSQTVDQGYAQDHGEALAVLEENSFNCFSYQVESEAGGTDPNSAVRMCEIIDGSRFLSASDAQAWDTTIAAASPGHPPAQWFPLQRDWSGLALFRPVSSNASFVAGHEADKATDGKFSTEAGTSAASVQPYLQIDLGSVRDISDIRIFPTTGQAAKLKGFRVYASINAMNGAGLPGGAGVRTFAPETGDDVAYDRWNIWTRDAANPSNLMKARYIRLQHPASATLRVAEVQVFGDVHAEPPAYPDAVCDPVANDGLFNALVWDSLGGVFRSIEVRGDMLWNGSGAMPGCTNYSGLLEAPIWPNTVVGSSGTLTWNLSQDASHLIGTNTGFESSTRVGAEFDLEAGFIAKVQAGGSYEFSKGITEDVQTSSFWGSGLEIGGAITGFDAAFSGLINSCRYNPRPYAYHLVDRSNTGYQHDIYTVDYVVHQSVGLWQRASVPPLCLHEDAIFADGFD